MSQVRTQAGRWLLVAMLPLAGQTALAADTGAGLTAPSLQQLQNTSPEQGATAASGGEESAMRMRAVQEAAQSYGMRGGLLFRSKQLRGTIDRVAPKLDTIFNFTPLMLVDLQPGETIAANQRARYIIPPVIVQAQQIFEQTGPNVIRLVDQTYRIEAQAKFSSVPPTWRTYLYRDLGETSPTLPHSSLLPKNDAEKAKWDKWVAEGYQQGIAQADQYFEVDLNRLARDFNGMVLYHELVLRRMVSLPYIATANAGVTGSDSAMNINDVTLRITATPGFRRDAESWVPLAPR